ncbi:hypothetical protein ACOMHN_022037 [Nucella lapillus]
MGCKTSKVETVEPGVIKNYKCALSSECERSGSRDVQVGKDHGNGDVGRPRGQVHEGAWDPRCPVDARQAFRLRQSWKAIKRNIGTTGVEMFLRAAEYRMGCGTSTAVHPQQCSRVAADMSSVGMPDTSIFQEEPVVMFNAMGKDQELTLRDAFRLKQSWRSVRRHMKAT